LITAEAIRAGHSDIFTFLHGNLDRSASHCDVAENASNVSLVFVSDAVQLAKACLLDPAILVLQADTAKINTFNACPNSCYFSVSNMPMGMAVLLKYFDRKSDRFTQWGPRHPTSVVHPDAHIGEGVYLGPYCVIGSNATIGDECMIGSHSVIENDAIIGKRTVIHPHVFVGSRCEIGVGCEIHPHTTVGSDGFGYAVDRAGRACKISHLGNVIIGDNVEIGSSCCIDRATLTSTRIRSGTKLDNLCHIAHNCDLGEDGFYTAGFMMGGSTTIGRRFVTGGNTVVTAHVTLGDGVVLAGRSTVTCDVPAAGSYGGYPLQPINAALKTLVNIGRISDMRKSLNRVMKHLKLDE
jgi:UDP-3-O-[3-hydroxymyristoyl] glucosamine N-acyltransferase